MDRLIRYFTPDSSDFRTSEGTRQVKLVVFFSLVIVVCGVAYGSLYLALGMRLSAGGAVVAFVVPIVGAFLFRRLGSATIAGNILAFACFAALVGVTLGTGCLRSPAVLWFALCPLIATMISGRRYGGVWLAAALGYFAFLWSAEGGGWLPASETPPFFDGVYRFAVPTGLGAALLAIAWSYEVAKEAALVRIQDANRKLRNARDAAQGAHRGARLVLDHVAQGLVVVSRTGRMEDERSRALSSWFGDATRGEYIWELFASVPRFAQWLRTCWEELENDFLPEAVVLSQLPSRLEWDGLVFSLEYRPINDSLDRILVVITDVSVEEQARRTEEMQQDQLAFFLKLATDRAGVLGFMKEARPLVERLTRGIGTTTEQARWLHTLKGNASLFGLRALGSWIHELEGRMTGSGELSNDDRNALRERWRGIEETLGPLLEHHDEEGIVVDRASFERVVELAGRGEPGHLLVRHLREWEWDSAAMRLHRLAERGRAIAERLGKDGVEFVVEDEGIRVPAESAWFCFWSAIVHVLRNAVDHGIESLDERRRLGKAGAGRVVLRSARTPKGMVLSIADDGRGIDWERLERRALSNGFAANGPIDRMDVLFADGVSSRDEMSELSGRGIGMSAVREACEGVGGTIEVDSVWGEGTLVRFHFRDWQGVPRHAAMAS